MSAIQHLPDDLKKSFGFKLAVYILPGIMFALVTVLIVVPAPNSHSKQGLLQGHINAPMNVSSTLVVIPVAGGAKPREFNIIPEADYQISLPVGRYHLNLKEESRTSPQLPRTLTIVPTGSAIFDITIE